MNITLTVRNRAILSNAPDSVRKKIKQVMTLQNPEYVQAQKYGRYCDHLSPEIELYKETLGGLSFPRGWARPCVSLLREHEVAFDIHDLRRERGPVELEFQGQLRPYQKEAVNAVLTRQFGALDAATGSGKTIMALAIIAARKQPTIILVHTKELLHQWADRIRSFLGIEPGLIGDGKFDIQPVTVGIVNTVRKHLHELPEHFGHVVVDEAHRTPSSMFTETIQAFDSKFMLGLSATPYRRDGLTRLIYLTLGDRVHQVDPQKLKSSGAVLSPKVIKRETKFRYSYADDYPQMISALVQDRDRNQMIALDVIEQCGGRLGTALVVSDRVHHCNTLADLIEDGGGLRVRVLTGKCSKADRESIVAEVQSGEVDVLISTVQLLGEGFDCSGLSSLFLATPIKFKGRVFQVVGRILRPEDGKRPAVFDYVDQRVGVLQAQAKTRGKALAEVAA